MVHLARKIHIFPDVDGVVLQPAAPSRNHPSSHYHAIKIKYGSNKPLPLLEDWGVGDGKIGETALEAHGIIGLVNLVACSFLICITQRAQVAHIRGKSVYCVRDVALVPLSSGEDAKKVIVQAHERLKPAAKADDEDSDDYTDYDEVDDDLSDDGAIDDHVPAPDASRSSQSRKEPDNANEAGDADVGATRQSSIVADVFEKKGRYGRFADRWFSRRGWKSAGRRMQGMSAESENRNTSQVSSAGKDSVSPKDFTLEGNTDEVFGAGIGHPKLELAKPSATSTADKGNTAIDAQSSIKDTAVTLLPKFLRFAKLYFSSNTFYFSYDYDISRDLARQSSRQPSIPLFKQFDGTFFWNRHLLSVFIDSGQHVFALPVMQGFVGQRAFSLDFSEGPSSSTIVDATNSTTEAVELQELSASTGQETNKRGEKRQDFVLTVVGRRSIQRAGLRYLRRGIDENGNVANFVESEQLLSTTDWDSTNGIYSFLQIRGSIPLFFRQDSYSLKPVPVLFGSSETNKAASQKHFAALRTRYGTIQIANLVNKQGNEAKIGECYSQHVRSLNESRESKSDIPPIEYEWFDFHAVCRGMKFENVKQLIDTLQPSRETQGWTLQSRSAEDSATAVGLDKTQSGVLRTNCMDCLDRTNVVQASTARAVLEAQLADQNFSIDLQHDPTTSWFNTLWADHGDALSRQYAGTAALKGDYTRTRKRNPISGPLTDLSLTLNRYYVNLVNDYFAQAAIDFLLGHEDASVFVDFDADMKSEDTAINLQRVRKSSIDSCAKAILSNSPSDSREAPATGEVVLSGWTVSCPARPNALRPTVAGSPLPFEECVLLVTNKAVYLCRYDWSAESVKQIECLDLLSISTTASPHQKLPPDSHLQPPTGGHQIQGATNTPPESGTSTPTPKTTPNTLGSLQRIQKGIYVTSVLAPRHTDPDRNVGFLLWYLPDPASNQQNNPLSSAPDSKDAPTDQNHHQDHGAGAISSALSTASASTSALIASAPVVASTSTASDQQQQPGGNDGIAPRFLAFKALPLRSTAISHFSHDVLYDGTAENKKKEEGEEEEEEKEKQYKNEDALVEEIVGCIVDAARRCRERRTQSGPKMDGGEAAEDGEGKKGGARMEMELEVPVERRDVISVEEARRSTGYLEQWGYSIKKFVWA